MVNRVFLIGNLGADPELRYTQSGTAVATLSVATTRKWKDRDGNMQEETEWHRCLAWNKKAEFCGNYLNKGAKIYVEGRLKTRKWEDQQGSTRYTTEIIADTIQNLSPRQNADPAPPTPDRGYGGTGEDVPF